MSAPTFPALGSRWWSVTNGRVAIVEQVDPEAASIPNAVWVRYRFEKALGKTGRSNSRGRWLADFLANFEPVKQDEAVQA